MHCIPVSGRIMNHPPCEKNLYPGAPTIVCDLTIRDFPNFMVVRLLPRWLTPGSFLAGGPRFAFVGSHHRLKLGSHLIEAKDHDLTSK